MIDCFKIIICKIFMKLNPVCATNYGRQFFLAIAFIVKQSQEMKRTCI